jgi:hypothetical protein
LLDTEPVDVKGVRSRRGRLHRNGAAEAHQTEGRDLVALRIIVTGSTTAEGKSFELVDRYDSAA